MKYVIINPSDPYTIEHDDILAAAAACILLGRGQYALEPVGDEEADGVPMFMFGGLEEWWEKRSPGVGVSDWIDANPTAIAEAMESAAMQDGHESSSLNDIGGRAKEHATRLRAGLKGGPQAPQQVFAQPGEGR